MPCHTAKENDELIVSEANELTNRNSISCKQTTKYEQANFLTKRHAWHELPSGESNGAGCPADYV